MELNLIQRLFPKWALSRAIARVHLLRTNKQAERYLESGQWSSFRRPAGPDVSPQAITQDGAEATRKYARNLDENSDIAIGILDTLVNHIVGSGLIIQPMMKNRDGTLNTDANQAMLRILEDWSERPTADRQTSFVQAQRLLCRSWLRDGEVLINKLMGNTPGFDHRGPVPYTLELLEADYLPFVFNESDPRLIIQGVHLTQYYEPIAYYLSRVHPGDIWNAAVGVWTSEADFRRVPAESIIHLKFTRRVNQVRGVSVLHGVIRSLENVKDYLESEQMAARIAAAFSGYIKKSPDAVTNINEETGDRDLEMSPGMIFDNLLPGEEIGTIDSKRPNTAVNEFTMGQLKRVASGTGTNYSTIARDYEGSYSSQRQSMVEAKPAYDALRAYFVDHFIKPVYRDIMEMALMSGQFNLPRSVDPETAFDVEIPKTAMPWIDPKKEVEADILRIDNQLASRSQVIAERGGNPQAVAKQIENDELLFPTNTGGAPDELDAEPEPPARPVSIA